MASNIPLLTTPAATDMPIPRDDIDNSLARMESEVGVPVVMGEGIRWCKSVLHCLEGSLEAAWGMQLERNRQTLKETLKTEVELAAKVEKLKAREADVTAELSKLTSQTRALCRVATDAEGSKEPTQKIEALREAWLGWIVHCRAITKEVQTWFIEANYRDVGAGD